MKVLVTGANGFLGSHVVRALLEAKYEVKAFILNGTSENNLKGLSYESYHGNLLQYEDIENALDSCDCLIHTAAITDVSPARNHISWTINYDLVKLLTKAVKKKSIQKYIHVGTANSFGFGTLEQPGTEESEFNCGKYKLDYIDSKKAAQDYLLDEVKNNKLPVVILNPTFMIGELDSKPGSGEMIISVIQKKVPGYSAGGRCFAAVKDVAKACVSALKNGRTGECYITGGVNLCYKDFFHLVAKTANVTPPKLRVSKFLAITMAGILKCVSWITRKPPKLNLAMAKISSDGHYYSSQKAMDELEYKLTDLSQALQEAIRWYQANGYLLNTNESETDHS
ncbi:MAG: NAD-dependent epimerase/dehydratase family protein [Bacilli bacterium]|nr:NAD-dependent epimerase/dehydratase family protein [Bacilli bacterium]MBN2877975.1 NAD-dependent epimerase/dehydratase family protein [Bacilli bacterium]